MAICYDINDVEHVVDLLDSRWNWHIMTKKEFDEQEYEDTTYEELLKKNTVVLSADYLGEWNTLPMFDPVYPDRDRRLELVFSVDDTDVLKKRPVPAYVYYPVFTEEDLYMDENSLELNDAEKDYFLGMLKEHLGIKEPKDKELREVEITIQHVFTEKHKIVIDGDDYKRLSCLDKDIRDKIHDDAAVRLWKAERTGTATVETAIRAFDPYWLTYHTMAEWSYVKKTGGK